VAAFRNVSVRIPESHAKRIEEIDGRELETIVQEMILNWFDDERRRDIPVKRQGISWSREVYAALLKHVGVGGISRFIREAVYDDLSKSEKDLIAVPDWKEGREEVKNTKLKRDSPPDRLALQAPIIFPAQWIERIEVHHPGKVSTYIKAVTQLKLEKQYKIELPVQKGMGPFLNR
jgi:Arc/MetJ-type ribon-helix-helix transcriptional regulator